MIRVSQVVARCHRALLLRALAYGWKPSAKDRFTHEPRPHKNEGFSHIPFMVNAMQMVFEPMLMKRLNVYRISVRSVHVEFLALKNDRSGN